MAEIVPSINVTFVLNGTLLLPSGTTTIVGRPGMVIDCGVFSCFASGVTGASLTLRDVTFSASPRLEPAYVFVQNHQGLANITDVRCVPPALLGLVLLNASGSDILTTVLQNVPSSRWLSLVNSTLSPTSTVATRTSLINVVADCAVACVNVTGGPIPTAFFHVIASNLSTTTPGTALVVLRGLPTTTFVNSFFSGGRIDIANVNLVVFNETRFINSGVVASAVTTLEVTSASFSGARPFNLTDTLNVTMRSVALSQTTGLVAFVGTIQSVLVDGVTYDATRVASLLQCSTCPLANSVVLRNYRGKSTRLMAGVTGASTLVENVEMVGVDASFPANDEVVVVRNAQNVTLRNWFISRADALTLLLLNGDVGAVTIANVTVRDSRVLANSLFQFPSGASRAGGSVIMSDVSVQNCSNLSMVLRVESARTAVDRLVIANCTTAANASPLLRLMGDLELSKLAVSGIQSLANDSALYGAVIELAVNGKVRVVGVSLTDSTVSLLLDGKRRSFVPVSTDVEIRDLLVRNCSGLTHGVLLERDANSTFVNLRNITLTGIASAAALRIDLADANVNIADVRVADCKSGLFVEQFNRVDVADLRATGLLEFALFAKNGVTARLSRVTVARCASSCSNVVHPVHVEAVQQLRLTALSASDNVHCSDRVRVSDGGAVKIVNVANATFIDASFAGNVGMRAGAVYLSGRTAALALLVNATFVGNTALTTEPMNGGGGAIYADNDAVNSAVTIESSMFRGNTGLNGGAVCVFASHQLLVRNSTFLDNVALASGGGLYTRNDVAATIDQSLFQRNRAVAGGGVGAFGSRINVTASDFLENEAPLGSALHSDARVFVTNVSVTDGAGRGGNVQPGAWVMQDSPSSVLRDLCVCRNLWSRTGDATSQKSGFAWRSNRSESIDWDVIVTDDNRTVSAPNATFAACPPTSCPQRVPALRAQAQAFLTTSVITLPPTDVQTLTLTNVSATSANTTATNATATSATIATRTALTAPEALGLGAIVGIAVGGAAVLALIAAAVGMACRRSRRSAESDSVDSGGTAMAAAPANSNYGSVEAAMVGADGYAVGDLNLMPAPDYGVGDLEK